MGADGRIVYNEQRSIFACMLRMGVTTAVAGNCGENKFHPADYLDLADRDGVPVNVAMLAGHEYFRHQAGCTDNYAAATKEQKAEMAREIEKSLERGCAGVSYGIRYVPGMDIQELLGTAAGAAKHGKLVAAHIRDDAGFVFDAAREFLDAGLRLGVPMEVSHIGSMAGFGQMEAFLGLIDSYRLLEPRIGCDCYPYAAFSTNLGSATYDEGWRERYQCSYDAVELAEGKYKGQRCTKEIFDETRRDFPACMTICYVMRQDEVDLAYSHPGVMVGSDGTLSTGQGHPRASGAFPRVLSRYVGGSSATLSGTIKLIGYATFASLWAYEGWTNLNTVAGEMKKPKRDIPLAIIISMGAITLIYTLFNLAIYRVIPQAEVNSMVASGNVYLGRETAFRLMGNVGKWIVLIGMFIGIIGTVNGDCLVFPRTYYAMSKGGYFFKSMGKVNDKGVPANAILASSALAVVLVLFQSLQELTDWLITVSALINLLGIIAVLVFRKKYPDMERPYKVWGGIPTIIVTIILFVILLVNNFVSDPIPSLKGLIIIAVCVPFYFIFRKINGGVEYDTDKIDN